MSILDIIIVGKTELIVSGLAGSIVAAVTKWDGWTATLRKLIVGTIAAMYLSPLAAPIIRAGFGVIDVPKEGADGVSGFVVGMCGIVIIEVMMNAVKFQRGAAND